MRVSDLTGALLDYWTARAEGVPAAELEIRDAQRPDDPRSPKQFCVRTVWDIAGLGGQCVERIDYSTEWRRAGRLLEKHEIDLAYAVDPARWQAEIQASAEGLRGWYTVTEEGNTPLIAICHAVVRAAFGDEVEDLPC
jgi:hypothetical protein